MATPRSVAISGRTMLPIVQGGMGVGVSANWLVSAVEQAGAAGTNACIGLCHRLADVTNQVKNCGDEKDKLNRRNWIARDHVTVPNRCVAICRLQTPIEYWLAGMKPERVEGAA